MLVCCCPGASVPANAFYQLLKMVEALGSVLKHKLYSIVRALLDSIADMLRISQYFVAVLFVDHIWL